MTRAGQEIYFEERNAFRVVTSVPHYMVKCTSLTPAMWIDPDPKDT